MKLIALTRNFNKYGSMLIGKHKDINMNIDINSHLATVYQSIKLLGVKIDCQLTFWEHIIEICRKSSQRIEVVMRLLNLTPTASKLQLYKAAT